MPAGRLRVEVWVLALLLAGLAAWTTVRETRHWRKAPFADFNYLQTGGECLVAGCDPYFYAALNAEGVRRGEHKPTVWPMTPVYPPSTLLMLLPFAGLGWPLAAYVFNALAGLSAALACVLLVAVLRVRVWDPAALVWVAMLTTAPMAAALEFGNPALLCTGLTGIACVLLLLREGRTRWHAPGWVLLGLALALKPQLAGGPAVALLLLRGSRVAAVKAWALAAALLAVGILLYRLRLGSFGYFASLRWAVQLSKMPGGSSDFANNESFDFLNIQAALARLPGAGRTLVNSLAWNLTAALAAATVWLVSRRETLQRMPWTVIALGVGVSVLPVYHRGYDRVVALLLAPAAMELAGVRRSLGWAYALVAAFWVGNDTVLAYGLRRWRFAPQNGVEDAVFCGLLLLGLWCGQTRSAAASRARQMVGVDS